MKHTLQNTMTKAEYIFGICYLAAQQFAIPFLLLVVATLLGMEMSSLWINIAFFAVNFVVILFAFWRYLGKNLRHLGRNFLSVLGVCVAGFLLYWSANFLMSLLIYLNFPDYANANDVHIQSMASEQYWVIFASSVLLVPLTEETLYRGVIFGFLDRYSRPLAYIFSVSVFAAIHVVGYIGTTEPIYLPVGMLQYVPAGLCLSWAYARTDTIFAPVMIHTAVNLMGMLAMR